MRTPRTADADARTEARSKKFAVAAKYPTQKKKLLQRKQHVAAAKLLARTYVRTRAGVRECARSTAARRQIWISDFF